MTGSVGTVGGTSGNGWNKFKPAAPLGAPGIERWNDLEWPKEFPLAYHEMSILLPHFLNEGRGKLDTYFSRVYNPIWTNPDGFSWMEALTDPEKVECHVALPQHGTRPRGLPTTCCRWASAPSVTTW